MCLDNLSLDGAAQVEAQQQLLSICTARLSILIFKAIKVGEVTDVKGVRYQLTSIFNPRALVAMADCVTGEVCPPAPPSLPP